MGGGGKRCCLGKSDNWGSSQLHNRQRKKLRRDPSLTYQAAERYGGSFDSLNVASQQDRISSSDVFPV